MASLGSHIIYRPAVILPMLKGSFHTAGSSFSSFSSKAGISGSHHRAAPYSGWDSRHDSGANCGLPRVTYETSSWERPAGRLACGGRSIMDFRSEQDSTASSFIWAALGGFSSTTVTQATKSFGAAVSLRRLFPTFHGWSLRLSHYGIG